MCFISQRLSKLFRSLFCFDERANSTLALTAIFELRLTTNSRLLKIAMQRRFVLATLLALSMSAFAQGPKCFEDVAEYMDANYGIAHGEDENLEVKKERYGKAFYYVVRDKTSGTNHPITLLMPTKEGCLRNVLTTYPVAVLAPVRFDRKGFPTSFRAFDQGTISHEITYAWYKEKGIFEASKCRRRTWYKNRATTIDVSCDTLFEQ